MTSNSNQPSDRDQRLQEILAEYLELVESGSPPDPNAFLSRHPDFADELAGFLDDHDSIERFLVPLREDENKTDVEIDPTIGFGETTGVETGSLVRYIGDYEILEEVARGGMGVVFKARQVSLNRVVALKMILSGQFAHEDDVQRFRAEAEAAASLDHPGIVPIYEIGQFDGQHYFSMGLVEGASLADKIKDGPLEPRTAAEYLKKIAEAVAFAHDNGVIHRDLKPGNVLIDANDQPKVTDFGLAKRYEDDSELTATGQILGTPGYMPPEQAAAMADQMGPLADVYSLGAVLYCLLTGRPPFQSANVMDTLRQVVQQEPVPPRQLNPAVPRDLETICLHCLQKAPRKRYLTAAALGEDLQRYLTHHPISARPVGRTEKALRWAKRNPAIAGLSALAVVLLIVGTITSSIFAIEADRQRRKERTRADAEADAKREAETAKKLAETNEAEALRNLYRARLFPMKKAWQERDFGRLDELLTESIPAPGKPDFRGWEWYYFFDQCREVSTILPGSAPYASIAAWNTGTRNLAAATQDGSIDIWNMSKDEIIGTLPTLGPVYRLIWDPDGSRIASLLKDGRIVIRDAKTGSTVHELPGGKDGPRPLVWSPSGQLLAYGHSDGTVFVWDTRDWSVLYRIPLLWDSRYKVVDLAWHPESRQLASTHMGGYLTVWDVVARKRLVLRPCDTGAPVYKVCWNGSGNRLVTGTRNSGVAPNIMVLNASGNTELSIPIEKTLGIRQLFWSSCKRHIVSGSDDGRVAIWDSSRGKLLHEVRLQLDFTRSLLAEDTERDRIISACDRGLVVLNVRSGKSEIFRHTRLIPARIAAWSPNGQTIAICGVGNPAILDAYSGEPLHSILLSAGS